MEILTEKFGLESDLISDNIVIALLSDLHYSKYSPNDMNSNIIKAIKQINPNYIVLAGDYFTGHGINNFITLPNMLKELLLELSKIAPVIISLGNHDLTIKQEILLRETFRLLKKDNIYPLDNESIEFENILFSGFFPRRNAYAISRINNKKTSMIIEDWKNSSLEAKKEKLSILINHIPEIIVDKKIQENAPTIYNYDIVLAGHAHNGWLSPKMEEKRINKLNSLIEVCENDKTKAKLEAKKYYGYCESIINNPPFISKYTRGMHDINGLKLIISKGITSGIKFAIGPKFLLDMFKGNSFVTEVTINPSLKLKKE